MNSYEQLCQFSWSEPPWIFWMKGWMNTGCKVLRKYVEIMARNFMSAQFNPWGFEEIMQIKWVVAVVCMGRGGVTGRQNKKNTFQVFKCAERVTYSKTKWDRKTKRQLCWIVKVSRCIKFWYRGLWRNKTKGYMVECLMDGVLGGVTTKRLLTFSGWLQNLVEDGILWWRL